MFSPLFINSFKIGMNADSLSFGKRSLCHAKQYRRFGSDDGTITLTAASCLCFVFVSAHSGLILCSSARESRVSFFVLSCLAGMSVSMLSPFQSKVNNLNSISLVSIDWVINKTIFCHFCQVFQEVLNGRFSLPLFASTMAITAKTRAAAVMG